VQSAASLCAELNLAGCRQHQRWQAACRLPRRRQGPPGQTVVNGDVATATCRVWQRRQGGAGIGPGGTCHVSPGQGCGHSQVVFFDKFFQRWFFLPFHWCRWCHVSKIRVTIPFTGQAGTLSRFLSLLPVRPASASGYHDELAHLIRVSLDLYLPELKFHGPASDVLTVAGTTTSGQYYVHSDVLYLQNTTLYVFKFRHFAWLINSDITTMHKTSIKMSGRCSTTEETRTTLLQIISSCAFIGTMDIWSNGWKWKYT
jgi:hypothetical protein